MSDYHPALQQFIDAGKWKQLSCHLFAPEEIYSPACLLLYPHKLDAAAMLALVAFRKWFGYPLHINTYKWGGAHTQSGVRDSEGNMAVNGVKESMHLAGKAFDLKSPNTDIQELYEGVVGWGQWRYIQPYFDRQFIHVDCRMEL